MPSSTTYEYPSDKFEYNTQPDQNPNTVGAQLLQLQERELKTFTGTTATAYDQQFNAISILLEEAKGQVDDAQQQLYLWKTDEYTTVVAAHTTTPEGPDSKTITQPGVSGSTPSKANSSTSNAPTLGGRSED